MKYGHNEACFWHSRSSIFFHLPAVITWILESSICFLSLLYVTFWKSVLLSFDHYSQCRMNPLYQITNQFLFNRSINGSGYNEGLAKDRFEYVFHHRFCFRAFMSFRSIRSKKFLLLFSTFTAVVNHNGSYM